MELRDLQVATRRWRAANFPPEHRDTTSQMLGIVEEVGELAHHVLKRHQGIRGNRAEHDLQIFDTVGDIVIFLMGFCDAEGLDLLDTVNQVWQGVVSKRDWKASPEDGVSA